MARDTAACSDLVANDLIVPDLTRLDERPIWFLIELIQGAA